MLHALLQTAEPGKMLAAGLLFSVLATAGALFLFKGRLPRDQGRDYALNGQLSAGKPRGAGLVFVGVFCLSALLFLPVTAELVIYLCLTVSAMLTGYLDDRADSPWGEYKKGLLDLFVAALTAFTYLNFNGSGLTFALFGVNVRFPVPVFFVLAVVLIWASINVTNCTDGVDGLSSTLGIVVLGAFYAVCRILRPGQADSGMFLLFAGCLAGYLWFNASPSQLLMGDAGSRAMGLIIGIAALKTGAPFLYPLLALVFILDGGLGLVKVALLRFCKIGILKKTRTPLHDHFRKNFGWSDAQTVTRFMVVQLAVCTMVVLWVL